MQLGGIFSRCLLNISLLNNPIKCQNYIREMHAAHKLWNSVYNYVSQFIIRLL